MHPPEICPHCGAEVPPKARACPECGSDEETGWSERAAAGRLGLPDEEFDYDEFLKEEFEAKPARSRPRGISWFWWTVAVLILVMILWALLRSLAR